MRSLAQKAVLILLVVASVSLPGCVLGNFDLAAHERFEKTVSLDPTGRFRLQNVNGGITVETWDQNSVQIEGEKASVDERGLREIQIDVRGQGDEVEVQTRMPRGGFLFGHSGKVEYHIRAPKRARIEVRTVNGGVRVSGTAGELRAGTVNGSVRVADAESAVEASTVNGSIQAEYRTLPEARHAFTTTNGSVTLHLPSSPTGEFQANTVNGGITTDFPLTVSGRVGAHHLQGRLGEGRGSVHIRTVNGSVKILMHHEKVVSRALPPVARAS